MNLFDLPYDVLHAITKSYLSLDTSSVKSCSLVCRRFHRVVRPFLQSTAVIRCSDSPSYMPLHDAVRWILPSMSPHLRHLVLFCHFPYQSEDDDSTSVKDLASQCRGNIEELTEIAIIEQLRTLENIDQLTFTAQYSSGYGRRSMITNATKLLHGFRITHIRRLVLFRVIAEVSFALFDSFPGLEELALIGIGMGSCPPRVQTGTLASPTSRSKVRILSLQLVDHVYLRFVAWASQSTCPLDFTCLHTFNFFVPGEISDVDGLQDTFIPFCGKLVTFNIAISNRYLGYHHRPIPFARLSAAAPALQTLRARIFMSSDYWIENTQDDNTPGFAYWLPTFLADFGDHNNLNTINVRCFFTDLFPRLDRSDMWSKVDRLWKAVDQTLWSTRLTIFSDNPDGKKNKEALAHLQNRLSMTYAKGNLSVVGPEGWRWTMDDHYRDI